jgi:hypothetical protein
MGQELIILYFSISREQPREVEFYALLSFLESCRIKRACRHVNIDDIAAHPYSGPLREITGSLIYMHLPDLVYLNKIRPLLPILKHNHNLTILGGDPAIGIKAIEILDTYRDVDIVVRAPESERVLAALVQACGGHRQWTTVEGITFRNPGDGHDIVSNENRPLAGDLDHLSSLGMAERGIFDSQWYPLITSRGCQYDCQYCGYQVPYRTDYQAENRYWRMKSHEKVVEEMAYLVAKGVCRFVFHCHQFFNPGITPDTGILAIAGEILNRKWQVAFRFSAKAGEIRKNQDSLFILRAAGLAEIDIGIDSGSRDFHQTYQTGSGVDDNIEVLAFLHRRRNRGKLCFSGNHRGVLLSPEAALQRLSRLTNTQHRLDTAARHAHRLQAEEGRVDRRVSRFFHPTDCRIPRLPGERCLRPPPGGQPGDSPQNPPSLLRQNTGQTVRFYQPLPLKAHAGDIQRCDGKPF